MSYGKLIVQVFKQLATNEAQGLSVDEIRGVLAYEINQDYGNMSDSFKAAFVELLLTEYAGYKQRAVELREKRVELLKTAREAKKATKQVATTSEQQAALEAKTEVTGTGIKVTMKEAAKTITESDLITINGKTYKAL